MYVNFVHMAPNESERSKYEGGGGNLRSTDGCGHHRCKERKDEILFFLFLLFAQCPPPATHQGGSLRSSLARCNPLGLHCQGRMGALPILPSISSPTALLISGKRRRDETTEREIRPFSYFSFEGNHSPDLTQAFKNDLGYFFPLFIPDRRISCAFCAAIATSRAQRESCAKMRSPTSFPLPIFKVP